MIDHEQERGPVTPRRGSGLGLAIAYYGIVGVVGTALAAWFLVSLVGAISYGCPPGGALCGHSLLELIPPFVASVVGLTLLPTARRLRGDPPRLGPLVATGVVVGVAVAVLPIVLILWAADFSAEFNVFGSKVPTVGLVVLFAGPLLWALASGVVVWRHAARAEEPGVIAAAPQGDASGLAVEGKATGLSRPGRLPPRVGLVVVALAGASVGAVVNRIWWKPPFYEQLIVLGVAFVIVVLGLLARRRGWIGRVSGASSVALLVGLVGGMVLGARPPFTESVGTMTVRLERPIERTDSGEARCTLSASGEAWSVSRDAAFLKVFVSAGGMFTAHSGAPRQHRADGLELVIGGLRPYAEFEGIGSTPDSVLEGRWDSAGGSLRFAKLAAFPHYGGPPSPLDPDLEGTIEWTCPTE